MLLYGGPPVHDMAGSRTLATPLENDPGGGARLAREAGAMREQLLDRNRLESVVHRLPELLEGAGKRRAERSRERQTALVNETRDADGGNGLREARDAGRLCRVHTAVAEGADHGLVFHRRNACGRDLMRLHPVPDRRVERRHDAGVAALRERAGCVRQEGTDQAGGKADKPPRMGQCHGKRSSAAPLVNARAKPVHSLGAAPNDGAVQRTASRMTRSMPLTTRARLSTSILSGVSVSWW